MITLVLGGARSGKSAWAEAQFPPGAQVLYVATARPWADDADFAERISLHQNRRPAHWITEDRVDLTEVLAGQEHPYVLVDDLGTWLTHCIDQADAWDDPKRATEPAVAKLLGALSGTSSHVVLVTPEVGMGVIPESAAGRRFRDEIGALNAQVAELAEKVVLVVAGIALTLKAER